MKEYDFPYIEDQEWMCDFGFLIDMTQHLNDYKVQLQGKGQFVYNLCDKIRGFERKLELWKRQLLLYNTSHFLHLGLEKFVSCAKYAQYIDVLLSEFQARFQVFKTEKMMVSMEMFSSPFNIDINKVPEEVQMELIEIQSNTDLRNAFFTVTIDIFYKSYVCLKIYPLLIKNAKQMMSLFGSTYVCEQLFSNIKLIKNEHR
jgi:hypothetical protein